MNRKRKFSFFLIIMLLLILMFTNIALAETQELETITLEESNSNNISESEAYKLLYENSKENNRKILSTIYWALSGIFGVVIAIIGVNLFFNMRINKDEIEKFDNKIENKFKRIESDTNKQIRNMFENNSKENKQYIKEEFEILVQKQEEQFKNFEEKNHLKLNNIQNKLKDKIKNNNKKINDLDDDLGKQINSLINDIEENKKRKDVQIYGLEAELWSIKGTNKNALSKLIEKANLEIELESSLTPTLGKLKEVMKNIDDFSTYDKTDINKLIRKIPDEYDLQKKELLYLVDENS